MRIVYLYREYARRRKDYGRIMAKLGHKVIFLALKNKTMPNQINTRQIMKHRPDLVFMLSPFYIAYNCVCRETVDFIKDKKIPIVVYSTFDTKIPYVEWMDTWRQFDFLFIHHKECSEYLRSEGLNAYYVPLGFYPNQYYRKVSAKQIDVSFMGNAQTTITNADDDTRVRFLKALKGFDLHVYGKSFINKLNGINVYPYSTHRQQRAIYAKTKVNLDLPFINTSHAFYEKLYHVKNRFFEIPATGNFMLTLKNPEFTNILNEDMAGYYEPDIESFIEMVQKYLKNEVLRNKMAERAYKEVHQKHTFYHRFVQIFKILEKSM